MSELASENVAVACESGLNLNAKINEAIEALKARTEEKARKVAAETFELVARSVAKMEISDHTWTRIHYDANVDVAPIVTELVELGHYVQTQRLYFPKDGGPVDCMTIYKKNCYTPGWNTRSGDTCALL